MLLDEYDRASSKLLDEQQLIKAQAGELVAIAGLIQQFGEQTRLSARLRRIAAAGIGLVLAGASLQLLDIAII
jgi:hypothetical protein